MSDVRDKLSDQDLLFMAETLLPGRDDYDRLVAVLREDAELFEAMLGADRLFERICAEREILVRISPHLFFAVLLRRAKKDLPQRLYTIERSARQRIPVFDTQHVADFLDEPEVPDYLADMLASFTKVQSFATAVRVREGVWHRYRFSDMDIDGLIRYCQTIEQPQRFAFYKRIGDVCLFLTGIFPEWVLSRERYPASGQPRPRLPWQRVRTMEDYREEGSTFYEMAAQHETAQLMSLDKVLAQLSERFLDAQKALTYIAERYLQFTKQELFSVG